MSFVHRVDELIEEHGNGLTTKADHWARVPLSRVATVVNGYPFPSGGFNNEQGNPVLRIRDIMAGKVGTYFVGDTEEAPCVTHSDLVIGMDGDFNSRLWPGESALMNQRVCKVVTAEALYSKQLLAYVLPGYLKLVNDHTSAVTVKHLSSRTVQDLPLPLPPRAEQDRLVSKLDELFSRIDEGERALEQVSKLVERYRQSVLKAAVTGGLTRNWREQRKAAGQPIESGEALLARILTARCEAWEQAELDKMQAKGTTPTDDAWKKKYKVPEEIVTDYLGDLPDGWQRVRIDMVGEVQLGRQRSPAHHAGEHMRPYLRVANVYEERIDVSDVMRMNFTPDEFVTYELQRGDVLLNEGQSKELIGRPAMYGDEIPGACFTNTLVRFRATEAVIPDFALIVFLHYMKSGDFQKIAKITTNIAHLGAGRFSEMAFPVPAIEEQREIVDRVQLQDSGYRHLLDDVMKRKKVVAGLRQSILNAAFDGGLVSQDPRDEPASVLLERIAAERAETKIAAPKRGRKKKSA